MNPVIIACKTLENELREAMKKANCNYPVLWLESGLHDVPKKLNTAIQNYLDVCTDHDTVILAFGFCGNAVADLKTHDFTMVVPRCDDCISLLLDKTPRPKAAYFLTDGWIKGEKHLGHDYDRCIEKYGDELGKHVFDIMLSNYKYLAMLDTGCYDAIKTATEIRDIAEKIGLEYMCVKGNTDYIMQLLSGPWESDRFIVVPPNSVLSASECYLSK